MITLMENLLLSLTGKWFSKSVSIWWHYGQEYGNIFFSLIVGYSLVFSYAALHKNKSAVTIHRVLRQTSRCHWRKHRRRSSWDGVAAAHIPCPSHPEQRRGLLTCTPDSADLNEHPHDPRPPCARGRQAPATGWDDRAVLSWNRLDPKSDINIKYHHHLLIHSLTILKGLGINK